MKSNNLLVILIVILNIVSFNQANSQSNPQAKGTTKEERATQMTSELNGKLKFDDKQSNAITAIHITFLQKMETERKDFDKKTAKNRLKVLDKIKELNLNKENAIRKILNKGQLDIYNAWLEETKAVKKESLNPKPSGEVMPNGEGKRPQASDTKYK